MHSHKLEIVTKSIVLGQHAHYNGHKNERGVQRKLRGGVFGDWRLVVVAATSQESRKQAKQMTCNKRWAFP